MSDGENLRSFMGMRDRQTETETQRERERERERKREIWEEEKR